MTEIPEREMAERARQGDASAIAGLYARYWRAARAAAFGVTGDFAAAEDAASEAFEQAMAGLASLRDLERFGPWLRTIAIRRARAIRRSRVTQAAVMEPADPAEGLEPALERSELAALIRRAALELPEVAREAVALVYFEGYATDAAAAFLNVPPGTLRRRLHDARKRIRHSVEQMLEGGVRIMTNPEREERIVGLMRLLDSGETHGALRGALGLRPPSEELNERLRRELSPLPPAVREIAARFSGSSARAADPAHPVGATAALIRAALVGFGRPPRIRAARALIHQSSHSGMREIVLASPDEPSLRSSMEGMRFSDVLDLEHEAVELREVQEMLEQIASAVVPGVAPRFTPHGEPRYRSALDMRFGAIARNSARGGILRDGSGAHIRIFLEPWAEARSGEAVPLLEIEHRLS